MQTFIYVYINYKYIHYFICVCVFVCAYVYTTHTFLQAFLFHIFIYIKYIILFRFINPIYREKIYNYILKYKYAIVILCLLNY